MEPYFFVKTATGVTGEPSYTVGATQTYHCADPLLLDWGGVLRSFDIAYETWGALNADKSNVILLHTGLSASSHAKSHDANRQPGWWEEFIGPGLPMDTDLTVEAQRDDPGSLLRLYRHLLRERRAFAGAPYRTISVEDNVLSFARGQVTIVSRLAARVIPV